MRGRRSQEQELGLPGRSRGSTAVGAPIQEEMKEGIKNGQLVLRMAYAQLERSPSLLGNSFVKERSCPGERDDGD
jgi:hypothetical protein